MTSDTWSWFRPFGTRDTTRLPQTGTHMVRPPWLSTLVAAVLTGLAAAVLSGPAAVAAESDPASPAGASQCAKGSMCLWADAMYSGAFSPHTASGASGLAKARSVRNQSSKAVRLYTASSATGSYVCFGAGQGSSSTSISVGYVQFRSSATC